MIIYVKDNFVINVSPTISVMDYRTDKYIWVLNIPDLASTSFPLVTQMLYYTHYIGVEEVAFTVWRTTKWSLRLKKYKIILFSLFKYTREGTHARTHTHT